MKKYLLGLTAFFLPFVLYAAFKTDALTVTGLTAGECVQTTTGGLMTTSGAPCGSGGGGGASSLEVFSNFDATRTSPTASISLGDSMKMTVSGSTAIINVDPNLSISTITVTKLILNDSLGGSKKMVGTYSDFGAGGTEMSLNMDNGSAGVEQLVIGSTNTTDKNIVFNGQNTGILGYNDTTQVLNYNQGMTVSGSLSVAGQSVCLENGVDCPAPTAGSTNYIQNTNTLQSGATAYPSFLQVGSSATFHGRVGQTMNDPAITIRNTNTFAGTGLPDVRTIRQTYLFDDNTGFIPEFIVSHAGGYKFRAGFDGNPFGSYGVMNFYINQDESNNVINGISLSQRNTLAGLDSSPIVVNFDGTPNDGNIYWEPVDNRFRIDNTVIFKSSVTADYGISMATATLRNLASQSCLGTDVSGNIQAGSCGGGGASSLAVGTGTASNFTNNITSQTAAISFLGSQFNSVAGGTTNFVSLNLSSVTVEGKLIAGSNITFTPGAGTLTIASTGGGAGDNLGSHVSTKTITAGFGIAATTGTFTGNVGFGTLTPGVPVHVEGSGYTRIVVDSTGNSGAITLAAGSASYNSYVDLYQNASPSTSRWAAGVDHFANKFVIARNGVGSGIPFGTLDFLTIDANGTTLLTPNTSGDVPLVAKGATSQTANLQQWTNSSNVVLSSVSASGVGTFAGLAIPSLPAQNCLGTNASGTIQAGSCGGGGGSSSLEVFSNFDATRTSPTASISLGDSMKMTVSGSTAIVNVDPSSVTAQGNIFNGASQLVQLNSSSQLPAVDASLVLRVSSVAVNAIGAAQIANSTITAIKMANADHGDVSWSGGVATVDNVTAANVAAGSLGSSVLASSFPVSGVTSGTYGSATQVSSITVNSQGIVTRATNISILISTTNMNASGTASATTFLRGDNTWSSPAGSGDAVLAATQTWSGGNTFFSSTTLLGPVLDRSSGAGSLGQVLASSGPGLGVYWTTVAAGGSGVTGSTVPVTIGFSGGGSVIAAGVESSTVCVPIPYALTLSSWTVIAPPPSVSGSISVTMRKASYANFPTFSAMSAGGNQPSLTSTTKNAAAVSGWTSNSISAGDIVCAEVTSATSVTRAVITLWGIRQ